jgi:hypothetical protein
MGCRTGMCDGVMRGAQMGHDATFDTYSDESQIAARRLRRPVDNRDLGLHARLRPRRGRRWAGHSTPGNSPSVRKIPSG